MIKFFTQSKWALMAYIFFFSLYSFSQAIIKVTVTSVQVNNDEDCDGLFLGESDFVWEYTVTDNTLGYTNNSPALFGVFDFNYTNIDNNNGPYNNNVNSTFFDRQYVCPDDVPTQINLAWEAYENDDAGPYDIIGLTDGETGIQNVTMAVPGATGTSNYSFTANGSGGGCNQSYTINLSVERVDFAPGTIILPDNICDALNVNMNTAYNIALCSSNSLEANEPRGGDIDNNNASSWFKFTAPGSGEVEITTDLGGTEIGTYFQLYHAADGGNCVAGIQPITATLIKDKFDYLSHIEFADGTDFLGIDPEAQLSFDACDPIPFFSYTKLMAGEVYYVQLTSDNNNESGNVELRVNDLGGSPASADDIPCSSSNVVVVTNSISSGSGDTPSTTIDFGCAFDGGNDAAETGTVHTNNDPTNYHAYDYDHPGYNNPVMNESVWLKFTAPNSGRIVFEADYQSVLYGENNALFGFDQRFAPGIPSDFSCANLEYMDQDEGGVNGFFGGDESAVISSFAWNQAMITME
jgi:hypothetical protein